jgi:integrase
VRSPKPYVTKDGQTRWKVRYRSADKRQRSETFADEDHALEFCRVLDAVGSGRALAWLDSEAQADDGQAVLTVDDLFEQWHAWKSARNAKGELRRVRSSRTLADYRSQYDRRIRPALGRKPAELLASTDVQAWVDRLGDELEPKTVCDMHALLHQVYRWATAPSRQLVLVDPCTETDLPKRKKKPPKGLHPEEWQLLYQAARDVDAAAADLLFFKVSTGWRISECFAVRCVDVAKVSDREVIVGMNRVLRREDGHYTVVEDAKSVAGHRRVHLVDDAAAMVLARVEGRPPDALLFTNREGSRWLYTSFYYSYWTRPRADQRTRDRAPRRQRILERAAELGLTRPVTPHWLRHTQAGLMILAGESPAAIQRRLGHASIKTTYDVYGQMIEDVSAAGLSAVNQLLAAPTRPELTQG